MSSTVNLLQSHIPQVTQTGRTVPSLIQMPELQRQSPSRLESMPFLETPIQQRVAHQEIQ